MRLSDLTSPRGSNKKNKRVGRGSGSGHGKTSCRGNKGAKSRSGYKKRIGFEGGQMPLIRRIPKRGFTGKSKTAFQIVNLHALKGFKEGSRVTPRLLKEHGLIKNAKTPLKVLGEGEITWPLVVSAHAFSKSASEKIAKAGGRAECITAVRGMRDEG